MLQASVKLCAKYDHHCVDLFKNEKRYYSLSIYRDYIWYDSTHSTRIRMITFRSDLHSRTTPHTLSLRASYGVSFVTYTKKMDRNISRAHCAITFFLIARWSRYYAMIWILHLGIWHPVQHQIGNIYSYETHSKISIQWALLSTPLEQHYVNIW